MANSSDSEGERVIRFGRRAQDSSSSRESSPVRGQKRSFSPTSDDEDLVIPSIPDDDTPPPPDRPLIRQAVGFGNPATSTTSSMFGSSGFSSSPTTAINTYAASMASSSPSATFLPGQTVAQPRKPKKTARRRPKGTYAEHSSRFRLTDITPSTSEATNPPPVNPPPTFPMQTTSSLVPSAPYQHNMPTFTAQQPSPAPTVVSVNSDGTFRYSTTPPATISASSYSPNSAYSSTNVMPLSSDPKGTKKAGTSKKGGSASTIQLEVSTQPIANTVNAVPGPFMDLQRSQSILSQAPTATATTTSSSYYRRNYDDYEADLHLPSALQKPQTNATKTRRKAGDKSGNTSTKQTQEKEKEKEKETEREREKEKKMIPRRMLTLLMTDMRTEDEDHQLAEVQVPLRPVDPRYPEEGYWANAEDVVEELQNSPCRIDGPAKVYTMRGIYRQFFLRVSVDNKLEVAHANLSASADRTIKIFIEKPAKPGQIPEPPRILRGYRHSPTPEPELETRYMTTTPRSTSGFREHSNSGLSRKRQASKSPTYSPSPPPTAKRQDPRSPKRSRPIDSEEEDEELFRTPMDETGRQWEYESPDDEAQKDPERLHHLIAERLDPLLQMDSEWDNFFAYKAQPQHVPAMLSQYRFIQRMADKLVGRRVPFRSQRHHRIQMSHILAAMQVNDPKYPKYGDDCTETLKLLSLYGPEGTRKQDPRIKEMMEDRRAPEYGAKPIRRFLHVLQEIDEDWNHEQRKQKALESRALAVEQAEQHSPQSQELSMQ
ncbi:hypothetical protein Moror_6362 [Moniliophthora roreri MCA 2997]|uniref:Uncharacterized protein n=1 Tax=Moniliophthora roreri (strain MCA 2997) TaxID=1381753 RepID=V2XWC5_MONRO|nr:hypothetical protein Moror_6362 [Moniliophthora roreri MCA 2997]